MSEKPSTSNHPAEEDDSSSVGQQDEDEDDKNHHSNGGYVLPGAYDASKYQLANAPSQVNNLFAFITHYSPQMIEIAPRMKPFIPDYIPTVGHVDAFIKIPFPDGRPNQLGLTVLDEPSLDQADASLLQMKLKALSKESTTSTSQFGDQSDLESDRSRVAMVTAGPSFVKQIDKWIESVQQLHETTARPESVSLMHQQPDHNNIDNLMQEWPDDLETTLNVHSIPSADLDCTLDEYIQIIAAILDVPIQSNKIASLYLIFSLLNEFQNSQHFNKYDNQQ